MKIKKRVGCVGRWIINFQKKEGNGKVRGFSFGAVSARPPRRGIAEQEAVLLFCRLPLPHYFSLGFLRKKREEREMGARKIGGEKEKTDG